MALKALMLKKKLDEKRKALDELVAKSEEFEKREAELEQAIEEAETDEEKETVETVVNDFEEEKSAHEEAKATLEQEVSELEGELAEEEAEQETPAKEEEKEERKDVVKMETRKFFNLSMQERDAIFAREEVQHFLGEVRSCIKEKRALENVALTIPEDFLGIIRQNIVDYSKLYKHVNVRNINGEGHVVVMGTIPEAIWTDCCANLNELSLTFNDAEVDCWKVGGYFAICNANLEDSDIALATEILTVLGQAIGIALDKAILYGTGTRMPLGFITRLAQTTKPSDYSPTARTWTDLSSTNIKSIPSSATGVDFFAQLALATANAKGKYSRGSKVWAMNETTYGKLVANSMSIDASGAIASGINGTLPVIGGAIEVLDFIPDNVIAGGYLDLYLLAERAGRQFATSEHVRFLNDQTVFKGTARYDGLPVIAEGFVAVGIDGTTPTADMTFAPDTANSSDEEEGA